MPAKKVARPPIDLQLILQALRESPNPKAATAIAKQLNCKSADLKPALESLLASNQIFAHPKSIYWHTPKPTAPTPAQLQTQASELLLQLSASELLSTAELKSRATAQSPQLKSKITAAHKQLLNENLLRELSLPNTKSKLCVNAQHPEPYLTQAITTLLSDFGLQPPPQAIQSLFGAREQAAPSVSAAAELLFAAVNRIAFAPSTTVTFHRLRQQAELASIPKAVFDQAALQLQSERRALLAEHGHAPRLPQDQQDELVTDGLGNFYVSIYSI